MSTSKCFAVERVGDTLVVVLGHHIMVLQETELIKERSAFIEEIQDQTIRAVVIDFSNVEYFGSILLDILCQAWKQLRQRGAKMALCNLDDISHEIIRKCRLDTLWVVYSSREDAFRALGAASAKPSSGGDTD